MNLGRRARLGREAAPGLRDRWLLSYADFLTLLLALFVVLYASARVDAERHRGLFEGLQSAFTSEPAPADPIGAGDGPMVESERSDRDGPERLGPERLATEPLAPLRTLERRVAREVQRERRRLHRDPGVQLEQTERGLVVSLAAAEYFPAGGAELAPERKRMLAAIAPLLAATDGSLHFEGHTDDLPVGEGPFPTNWELSSARAAAVARYFVEEQGIDPQRVAATGYAAYRPAVAGNAPADRARNRRVEIVVLRDTDAAPPDGPHETERELGRLLERLPPIPAAVDQTLRRPEPGPPPPDIPLP